VTYTTPGIKHVSVNVTNTSDFSSEYANLYAVGARKLELSQHEATNMGSQTKVDFTVSVPSAPSEIKRIEVFNFNRGFAIIENPTTLNHSVTIDGFGTASIVVTDMNGNKRAFVKDVPAKANKHFNVSELFMNEILRSESYQKHVADQPRI
jgi:hypothetical protein